jgi:Outer membrane protein beta-barrel domain
MRVWLLFLAAAASAGAQPFSFGVKGGLPLTDFFDAVSSDGFGYFSSTNRYIVGPTVELRLPFGLGVEFDALYRHLHYSSVESIAGQLINASTESGEWEFPLLAKFRFHGPLVRPYVDGGVAWDTLSGLSQSITQTAVATGLVSSSSTSSPAELEHSTVTGVVLGGGFDIHALVVHISPEIRYTRWISPHFEASPSTVPSITAGSIQSVQNQVEFLVGITF